MSIACGLSSVNGSVGGLPLFLRIPKPSPGLLAASLCVKGAAPGAVGCSEALTDAAIPCVEGVAEGQLWDRSLGVSVDGASAQTVGISFA